MRLTNIELCRMARHVAEDLSTLFVIGGYGARLTEENKELLINKYSYNAEPERRERILAADESVYAFDCVCFIKALLWGFDGRADHPYGGAEYASNGVPDIYELPFFENCYSKSDRFTQIVPGEMLWLPGHTGIYLGEGLAAECTPRWQDKVQITAIQHPRKGYMTRRWSRHGFLPYVDYVDRTCR